MPNLALDFGQTPYEAPELPQVQAPQPSVLPPPTSEGFALAPSKAGGIASIADNVMRGFMQGRAMAQASRAARLENTTKALQASYKLSADQLRRAVHDNNITPSQMAEIKAGNVPQGVDPSTYKSVKEAYDAVHGSWQAWITWLGQHVEQEGGKGKKGKGDAQKLPFLQRLAQGISGKDPAAVSQAIFSYYKDHGPPVMNDLASITATAQQRADALKAQGLQTAATEAGAQDVLDVEKLKKRERELLLKGDLTPDEQKELDRTRAALENTSAQAGNWKPVIGTVNGKSLELMYDAKTNRWQYPSGRPVEDSVLDSFLQSVKGAAPKVGSFGDFMTKAFGDNPTADDYQKGRKLWAESGAGTTVGTHVVMVPQHDGSIVPVVVETTSSKSFGGPTGTVTPKAGKTETPKSTPKGVVSVGGAVGGRDTPTQSKAKEDVVAAKKLASIAYRAVKSGNPVEQKNLALALVKGTAGRVNMNEYKIYTTKMGVPNTIEGLLKGITSGQLPDGLVKLLAQTAVDNLKAAEDAEKEAFKGSPESQKSATSNFNWDAHPVVNP